MMTTYEIQRTIDMPSQATEATIKSISEELLNQRQTNRIIAQENRVMRSLGRNLAESLAEKKKYYRFFSLISPNALIYSLLDAINGSSLPKTTRAH